MCVFSGLSSSLSSRNLGWKSKRVDEEQFCEVLELLNFVGRKFFVVMNALIAIETDKVRPFLQIRRQPATLRKQIDSLCQRFARAGWIQLASGGIKSFAEHRRCGVVVPPAGIVESLNEGTPHSERDALWGLKTHTGRVLIERHRVSSFGLCIEVSTQEIHNPGAIFLGGVHKANAQDLATSAAAECSGALVLVSGDNVNRSHGHICCAAMWAISNKGYGHSRSMVTLVRAFEVEA